ncbi:hypothetical protein [Streptomyces sp. NPDC002952]|uniref:hypothetical protein n=1 Tax=Streptomyces sp. NPDC002952 TaxID=3364673 RepID=UPI0036CEF3AF
MPTIDILYVGMIEANYSVHEDRNLWGLAKRMQTVRSRRKRREDDGGRPGV